MTVKRVMIAALKSGSGKTLATCALLQALKERELRPLSFKCGPDYIDPLFHEEALGIPSKNLDTFFTDEEQTKRLFLDHAAKGDFAVLEGVMGLYDGLGGIREEGSSYHLAKVTKTPIVLVADMKGMGRSVIPMIAGFLDYDKEHLVQGVLLNRVSRGYYEMVKPWIEEELKIRVVGFLPEKEELYMKSRHLGLVMPDGGEDIRRKLRIAAEEWEKTVSMEDILGIAAGAEPLTIRKTERNGERRLARGKNRPVIAVARDEAFCFYYADNIRMLEECGAEIRYFSPLRDQRLPGKCHGLLIGGGYPELYAEELSRNIEMRRAVREASKSGMPVVAECGGFLYLHSAMMGRDGGSYEMAGVLPAVCYDTGRSVRFGYIEIREKKSCFLPEGEKIKGHEFHYYDSSDNGSGAIATKPATGREYSCMIEDETHWMGFPHLYYPSNPAFAESFVGKAAKYAARGWKENEKFLSFF